MHILLLGATGRTGTLILQDLLSRNHTITALARNPTSLTPTPGLGIIAGSPLNQSSISQAITSTPTPPDAVIIALASVRASDSPFAKPTSPPRLMADTHIAVLAAMKKHGIKRLITISAFGVGDSNEYVFWPMRMVLNYSAMKVAFEDHNVVEEVVRREAGEWEGEGKGLKWTLVRPCMLKEGDGKEVSVFGEQGRGVGLMPSVSRESVARFVVERCLEKEEFVARTPVICD
ncbi:NAD(P)-binding protein [Hyaloscypha variabilis F]|uniref:NAD(P)-binding protein n=1 Tax=Hyaloscypha variabilis (strain UAMH 11265 / GT02V1 / F) TaxID=1149755 RepID=A0A2J6RJG0_HYAVF|nr:NAD(P)-binding protein [Hyaloscypha variabilis F]